MFIYKTNLVVFILPFSLLSSGLFFSARGFEINYDRHEASFSYDRTSWNGPGHWGQIQPSWKFCSEGRKQSPIDVIYGGGVQLVPNFGGLQLNYRPANATLVNSGPDISVEWIPGEAGNIRINGETYDLVECHWRYPEEHTLKGTRFDMEPHVVHLSANKSFAVIGIMFECGAADPLLAQLTPNLPSAGLGTPIGVRDPKAIISEILPFFKYDGSLTVPPCSENVIWLILLPVRTVSKEQVQALKNAVDHGFNSNARPLQQRNHRAVWLHFSKGLINP